MSPLRFHGGKHYLAQRIVELMPPHARYGEPYFGGGHVLFAKDPQGVAEFVNDINRRLYNFWRCLQSEASFAKFQRIIEAVPLSQQEFVDAGWEQTLILDPDLGAAVNFFINNRQSRQGLGRDYCTPTSRTRRGMNENVSAWMTAVDGLPWFAARLKRVEIWNRKALDFIRELDSPDTLFYCDPPYLQETRTADKAYGQFEMSIEDHETLLHHLHRIKGKFILSGYHSKMYDAFGAVAGWRLVEFEVPLSSSSADEKQIKTECIWMNYA